MNESDKYSESDRLVCYKHISGDSELIMLFNREIQAVDIELLTFHRNDEPCLEPMENKENAYSAKYGHWYRENPCIGMDDIEFLYEKSRELFE